MVQEADVEGRVVDDHLGAAQILEQFVGDRNEQRLVRQKLVTQPVNRERPLTVGALRVQVEMQVVAGQAPVQHLDAADLDHTIAGLGAQAGRFGVQEDLAHASACQAGLWPATPPQPCTGGDHRHTQPLPQCSC